MFFADEVKVVGVVASWAVVLAVVRGFELVFVELFGEVTPGYFGRDFLINAIVLRRLRPLRSPNRSNRPPSTTLCMTIFIIRVTVRCLDHLRRKELLTIVQRCASLSHHAVSPYAFP